MIALLRPMLQSVNKVLVVRERFLTESEKKMAQSVFGTALELDGIKIIAHRMVLKNYGISPNGHVYFNEQDWCEDFSTQTLSTQSWLIHELTHVWQIQQGIQVVRKAIFDRQYRYVLEQGKAFLAYGIEQQAQMVQDYYIRHAQGHACHAYESCIPFLKIK